MFQEEILRCRRRYVCGCERHGEKDHSTTSARRVRSAWLPRAGGAPGRHSRPTLLTCWRHIRHSRPTLMSAGSPAIPSRHFSPNAKNQPTLLPETPHPCRHSLPALISAGWREGHRIGRFSGGPYPSNLPNLLRALTWMFRRASHLDTAILNQVLPHKRNREAHVTTGCRLNDLTRDEQLSRSGKR